MSRVEPEVGSVVRAGPLSGPGQMRRVAAVALGAAAAHGALLLASPVLTRLYSPEQMGAYAYFYAVLSFLAPVAALRYELATPVPESADEAWTVVGAGVLASLFATLLVLLSVAAVQAWTPGLFASLGGSALAAWGLPLGVLAAGIFQSLMYWSVRNERFGALSAARGAGGAGTGLAQIALGLLRAGPTGLVLGDVAGRLAAALILIPATVQSAPARWRARLGDVLRAARRYRGFALLSTPAALLNSAALFLPLLIVGRLHGPDAAGLLFIAQRFIALPTTLLTTATSQVFVAEFARTRGEERARLYRRTLARLAAIAGPVFLAAGATAPLLFPILFGGAWEHAGLLALALSPYYFLQLLSGSTVSALDVMEQHATRLGREVIFLMVTLFAFAAGARLELSLALLVFAYGLSGAAFYALSLAWVHRRVVRAAR